MRTIWSVLASAAVVVAAMFLQISNQLDCFQCGLNSTSVDCDHFDRNNESFIVSCDPNKFQSCLTTTGKFGDVIVRSLDCGVGPATNSCSVMTIGSAVATVCSCQTDRCNVVASDSSVLSFNVKFVLLAFASFLANAF